jgi:hypothetical protein
MHMLKMIALATLAACAFAIPVTKDDHHRMLQAGDNEDYSFLRHMEDKVRQPHDSHPPCPLNRVCPVAAA